MPVTIPPFTNVPAPNDPVASAWAQQLTQFAVDQIVAQPDAPSSPNTELWYDTDDGGMAFPNMPRGIVGTSRCPTNDQGPITAQVDVSGLTVAWTADPTRQYRITANVNLLANSGTIGAWVGIHNGANASLMGTSTTLAQNAQATVMVQHVMSGVSGAQTVKVRADNGGSSPGTLTIINNANRNGWILVEDIGAAGQSGGGVWSDQFPRGFIGRGVQSSAPSIGPTETDVPGMTVTWIADPTRRYKTTAKICLRNLGAANEQYVHIATGANAHLSEPCGSASHGPVAANGIASYMLEAVESGLSGTQTRKMRCATNGTNCSPSAGEYSGFLMVEDIGKA